MQQFGLTFHHFGLAVRRPELALAYLAALGYVETSRQFDPLQGVNLSMQAHTAMPDVEVIWSGDAPSPIATMLKRHDTLIYHLCYSAADPAASIAAMEAAGFAVTEVSPSKPAVLFGGLCVSFHYVDGFGLIELLQQA